MITSPKLFHQSSLRCVWILFLISFNFMPLSSNLSILIDSGVLITKHSKSLCIFFGADTSTNNIPSILAASCWNSISIFGWRYSSNVFNLSMSLKTISERNSLSNLLFLMTPGKLVSKNFIDSFEFIISLEISSRSKVW